MGAKSEAESDWFQKSLSPGGPHHLLLAAGKVGSKGSERVSMQPRVGPPHHRSQLLTTFHGKQG